MFLTISITPFKGHILNPISYDKKFLSYRIGFRSGDIGFKIEKCYIHNIFTINCKWQVVMGYYQQDKKVISMVDSNYNQ